MTVILEEIAEPVSGENSGTHDTHHRLLVYFWNFGRFPFLDRPVTQGHVIFCVVRWYGCCCSKGILEEMKSILIAVGSFFLTLCVVMNAYYQKKQFYPSVVYITKSSPCMAVLYVQAFVVVIITGKFMRKLFFGQLRAAETEHLIERSWYAVTETCLAFTVFRDDFSPRFVALFTVLLFLKCFHWLAEDRIDYMERSPLISFLFHIRAVSLTALLSVLDLYFISHAYHNTLIKGPSVQLVFGFEYAVLLTAVVHVFVKYVLHAVDLHRDNPWENKAVYLLYTELILGGVKVVLYFLFLAIMIKVHTFPLFVIRPMYLTIREFKKALSDVVLSRRAIRNMNTLYPDATAEDLSATDNVCIICREEMHLMCKKLPCNHIFHTSCLRSWFQRQQTCPTCRMDVLRLPTASSPNLPQGQQPRPAVGELPPPAFHAAYPFWPPDYLAPQQPQFDNHTVSQSFVTSSPPSNMLNVGNIVIPQQLRYPFLPPMLPNLAELSEDELRRMHISEDQHVGARMQCLHNIQTLLNAAVLHLHQYISVVEGTVETHNRQPTGLDTVTTTIESPTVISTAPLSQSSHNVGDSEVAADDAENGLEGAVGYASPAKETTADVTHVETNNAGISEVRKRRIQHFSTLPD